MVELEEPDKGQAWVVAIAASIINMILSGLSRMIGLLYVAVIEEYGVSRQEATLPFTVRNSIRCLSGPLVGVIGQRYGIRAVTVWGGVVACLGATLCCIAPSVTWLAVFWGGLHGCGFAFANTLFQVVVNQYFVKYRATASGIALSGACIGSFVFPFMIEEILFMYGLSGGFLILGGVVMHVLPPALLLKAPPWIEYPQRYARLKALKMAQKSVETLDLDIPADPDTEDEFMELRDMVRTTSFSNCPAEDVGVCRTTRSIRDSAEHLAKPRVFRTGRKTCEKKDVVCKLYKIIESPTMDRKDSSKNGVAAITEDSNRPIQSISGDIDRNLDNKEDHPSFEDSKPVPSSATRTPLLESIKGVFILYTNPVYVLISLCMTTYVIIFIPLLTVIVDYSRDKGIHESAGKYLINAMAFGDLIGRMGFGWVTDKGVISIPVFIMLAFVLEGLAICLFPLAISLYSLVLLLIFYGITAGTILVHFPILVLKYVDVNLQSVALGGIGFFSGIVSFGIPPLIGHFRDVVGSYDGLFYVTGIISVVSGGLWLLVPLLARIQLRNERKKELAKRGKVDWIVNGTVSKDR